MTADVIEGPWKKIDKTEKELEIARVLAECDQITSDCVVDVLQNLVENGIAPDDPDDESIVYIMFLTDLIKAIVYKGADIEHPFQDIAFMLCGTAEEDGKKDYYVDYNLVSDVIDYLRSKEKEPA
jgi:hypothetical protein